MLSNSEKSSLEQKLTDMLKRVAPGAFTALDMAARRCCGTSFPRLLVEGRFSEAKELLKKIYSSETGLRTALLIFVAKPLVELLGLDKKPEELAEAMLRDDWSRVYEILGLMTKPYRGVEEDVGEMLLCIYAAEHLAVKAYLLLGDLLARRDPLLSSVSSYIGLESKAHMEAVKGIAARLGASLPEGEEAAEKCPDPEIKRLADYVQELEEKTKQPSSIDSAESLLAEAFRVLAGLEKLTGEEKYTQLLLPLMKTLFRGDEGQLVSMLIDNIVKDEEFHEEAAKTLSRLIALRASSRRRTA
ncbi:hypothetical protein PYJP_00730 [Pyrofollis japonicus]|uniref:hypothetical protein n=1 Tax=Pyrofollis japonicus TaxID=3060460 RepID=UPI00295BE94E|nr:hypothetical protein [Pyrofollis japonicus]BEP16721.1 hypothetical protein PYJP_00730 [Pyrofollis japonicus]